MVQQEGSWVSKHWKCSQTNQWFQNIPALHQSWKPLKKKKKSLIKSNKKIIFPTNRPSFEKPHFLKYMYLKASALLSQASTSDITTPCVSAARISPGISSVSIIWDHSGFGVAAFKSEQGTPFGTRAEKENLWSLEARSVFIGRIQSCSLHLQVNKEKKQSPTQVDTVSVVSDNKQTFTIIITAWEGLRKTLDWSWSANVKEGGI